MDCEISPVSVSKKSDSSYKRSTPSNFSTPEDWRKWKQQRKAEKRKWKEDKKMKELKKQKEAEAEEAAKKVLEEQEKQDKLKMGCHYTVSIALPGSILDNAQTPELKTYLAGQIARAAVIFSVDEIIIFDETGAPSRTPEGDYTGVGKTGHSNVQLARLLQYLECPQYLRKSFFPQHRDLQYAGLLNPLDCPHHVRADQESPFREGVVIDKPVKKGRGSYVNVGLTREVRTDKKLQPGTRVTVKMVARGTPTKLQGLVQPPRAPRTDAGIYWGYSVRLAASLGTVFTECPFDDGYDLMIGTSDKGTSVDSFQMPQFQHMLLVFGGLKGLEASLDADPDLKLDDPKLLFQHYLNTCPGQASNTIRTEEALLITLSALRAKIGNAQVKLKS